MRFKLLTLALVAGMFAISAPAMAQTTDATSGYTTTTPTTPTTPSSTVTDTVEQGVAPSDAGGGSSPSKLAFTGSETWILLGAGGLLAIGSALLLAREWRPRRNHR